MTNKEFKLWIQGYLSLSDEPFLNKKQIIIIENHSNLVSTVECLDAEVYSFLDFLNTEINKHEKVCCVKSRLQIESWQS